MSVILILCGIAGLVWFLAARRQLSVVVGGLLVVLIGTTFGHPFLNLDLGPIPLTIDRVLWGGLMLVSLALWKWGRVTPKPLNRTDLAVILLAVLLVASTLWHDWHYKENLPMSRLLFFNLIPMGLYFAVRQCRLKPSHLGVFFAVLAAFGVYLSVTAIAEQRGLYALVFPRYILDPEYWEFLGRARGPFLNPVSCGMFLAASLMATAFLWTGRKRPGRVLVGIASLMCIAACFLTLTRSVWFGCALAVAALAWLPARPQFRGALVVAGTLLLLVASLAFSDKLNRFQRDKNVTVAEMAQSASLRPMLAYVAFKMFRDKPLLGHGFGQYTAAKKPYHYHDTADMQLSRILPYMQHNVFLSYLTETGLFGLSLLLALLASLSFKSWHLWKSRQLPLVERQFGLLGMVIVANYVVNGMFHDVSIIPHIGSLLFLTLGITGNLYDSKQQTWADDIAGQPCLPAAPLTAAA